MTFQYIKFFINGSILGIISLILHAVIYQFLGINSSFNYLLATVFTYIPIVILNFSLQRHWVFQTEGLFAKFLVINLGIMLLASLLSPLLRTVITWAINSEWGDRLGFGLAAVILSVPSYLFKRSFVFNVKLKKV